jgi:hypothetical protein
MRTLIRSAAFAAMAASLSLTAVPAFAVNYPNQARNGTTFDLGIDVSAVPRTAKAVDAYVASLAPETQAAIMGACENYVQNPEGVQDISTLGFCQIAVGSGTTGTFASTNLQLQAAPVPRNVAPAARNSAVDNPNGPGSGTSFRLYPGDQNN